MAEQKLTMDIINAQGAKLMTAKKIYVRDGKIAMDGTIMGAMPGQFYVTPINLYKATKMIDFAFIKQVLGILKQGKKDFQAEQAEAAKKAAEANK